MNANWYIFAWSQNAWGFNVYYRNQLYIQAYDRDHARERARAFGVPLDLAWMNEARAPDPEHSSHPLDPLELLAGSEL